MEATHGSWGERCITFRSDIGIVTMLYLVPGQRCSFHHHNQSWNQFFVVSGKLGVRTDKGHTSILTDRQVFSVEPGVMHEFITYDEPTIVEEIAYVKYDPADIHRQTVGGPIKNG